MVRIIVYSGFDQVMVVGEHPLMMQGDALNMPFDDNSLHIVNIIEVTIRPKDKKLLQCGVSRCRKIDDNSDIHCIDRFLFCGVSGTICTSRPDTYNRKY